MYSSISKYKIIIIICIPVLIWACSTKKNTKTTRAYHEINTRYNIYFNANESYKEALKSKQELYEDTLTRLIHIFPVTESRSSSSGSQNTPDYNTTNTNRQQSTATNNFSNSSDQYTSSSVSGGGSFGRSIEKTTKAIKLHSIKSKPERDPSKRRDPKYRAWLQQQEFNPFLHNAWLLLGKSEYQDGDYLQAISTFSYIIRIYKSNPEIVAEARIWMVKANVALGWVYEAEDILNQIRLAGGVPDKLKPEYNKVYADFLLKKEEFVQAIPYVEQAIEQEGDRLQKTRLKFLLGQLYQKDGNRAKAYEAFDAVHGLSTPYFYSFNARIQQASFVDAANKQQILSMLNKMSKDHKNKDYLDQVYYAVGNIYLNDGDTVKAIGKYKESIEKSTRNGFDKALTQVTLGAVYFAQRDYVKAQPLYSDALNGLGKNHEDYPLVELRSSVLDELATYTQAIHLQDSLQTLARMPEAERMAVIVKLIEEIKRKEKEEQDLAEREALIAEREQAGSLNDPLFEQATPAIPNTPVATGDPASAFYFYNPQVVTQGKAAFRRRWGTRKLEDNWRRRNKQISILDDTSSIYDEDIPNDSIQSDLADTEQLATAEPVESNIYSPAFYLQQIPMTPEAIEQSNAIIEDAYYNLGLIYKDKLEDYDLAIEAFNTDIRRFPNTPNLEEIYYQLFLIYLRLGNSDMAEHYRRSILNTFPQSSYAVALTDSNYEWNMRNMYQLQDNLYQQTYDLYLAGQIDEVRTNYRTMKQKYPLSGLMPKFMFLNSMTYAQQNDREGFRSNLRELVDTYPNADVTPLATEMLRGIVNGRELSADNSPFRGMIWDIKFGGDSIGAAQGIDFIADAEAPHMLVFVYQPRAIDRNQLIYEVANYNFSNYVYKTFDLGFTSANGVEMLQVNNFDNLADITAYIDKAFEPGSLMSQLDPSIIPIPISTDNFIALMNGKTINEYFLFLEKNYTTEMLTLIRYWTQQREQGEMLPEEPKEEMPIEEVQPEVIPEPEIVSEPVEDLEPQVIPVSPNLPKPEIIKPESERKGTGLEDILSDDQIDKADAIIDKAGDIISNPVDGLKNLFKSSGDNSGMTKEEKEAEKEARKLLKEQEKQAKAAERARIKAVEDAEKARQDSIRNVEREKEAAEKAIEKAKQDEIRAQQKAREDARKQRQRELKEREKARKEELKQKERERNERLKQRERERKEKLKQREAERKEKERQARRNRR